MKRRSFVAGSLAAVAAGCSRPDATPPTDTPPKSSDRPPSSSTSLTKGLTTGPTKAPLGVALLGLGKYSREQLAPALQMTSNCRLTGIVTGTPAKIPVWRERYGIEATNVYSYETLPDIANNDAIDIVYIVTPTSLHARDAIVAANAGKHVWCEKPMAMTVDECQAIIDACARNGVKLSIGYRMQHEPNTQTVMAWAASKPYGAIEAVESLAGYPGSGGGSGWRFKKEMGGGALYDMGVYSIQGLRYATGEEPLRVVRAEHSTTRPSVFTEVDETTDFELEFPSGIRAHGRTSVGEDINRLRIECQRGWYELSPMQHYDGVQGTTSDGQALDQPIDDQQARQMDDDALAILEDRPVMVPGDEGLRDIRIVQAIFKSAATGKPVDLA